MFTGFAVSPGQWAEQHIVYQNNRGQFFTQDIYQQNPNFYNYRAFEINYRRSVEKSPITDCFIQRLPVSFNMATAGGSAASFNTTPGIYPVLYNSYGSQYAPNPALNHADSKDDWKKNPLTEFLASQVALILYGKQFISDDSKTILRWTHLHEHAQIGQLLAQYEPGGQVDPEALKVVYTQLKPLVIAEKADVATLNFVKQLYTLRHNWLKAAGDLYSLLAYLHICSKKDLPGAGPRHPSYPDQTIDLKVELDETRYNLEYAYSALEAFKLSPLFYQHITTIFTYFEQIKAENELRRQRALEIQQQMIEAQQKRAALKRRNESMLSRQLGCAGQEEMGQEREQYVLDWMSESMRRELGVKGEEDRL